MKKCLMLFVLSLVTSLLFINPVSAHVLVTDQTNSQGAILHIIPDDDPIAGEKADLYFDMQDDLAAKATAISLTISNDQKNETLVKVRREGSLVTAAYTFPAQGVYTIRFVVTSNGQNYSFSQAQRVTRGVSLSSLEKPSYAWAQVLFIGSMVGFAVLAIIIFNRRVAIAKQSTF